MQILPHEKFERRGNDLYYRHEISLKEALLGGEFELDLLGDKKKKVKLMAPVRTNTTTILGGMGMPVLGRRGAVGDVIVTFSVDMPVLNDHQKKVLEGIL